MDGEWPPLLSLQARPSRAELLLIPVGALRDCPHRVEWHQYRGLLPETAALECSQDAELGEEVVRLLHQELWPLSPERSAHYRIPAPGALRRGLPREHAVLRVDRFHCQHREAGRPRHGLLRSCPRNGTSMVGPSTGGGDHARSHVAG